MNCQYCERLCKNKNSLINHERLCKSNPNCQTVVSNFVKYNQLKASNSIPGSNQFTKAKNSGLTIAVSESTRNKLSAASKGRKYSDDQRKAMSTIMQKVVRENPHSYSASNINGRTKKVLYKDVLLDSKWELEFVKWCDSQNIIWERNNTPFEYEWTGPRLYFPDFFLSEYDMFVEVKGYARDRDYAKWNAVPNLIVIKYTEIKQIRNGTYTI